MSTFSDWMLELRNNLLEPDEDNSKWDNPILKMYLNEGYCDLCAKIKNINISWIYPNGSLKDQFEYPLSTAGDIVEITDVILDGVPADEMQYREVQRLISLDPISNVFVDWRDLQRKYYIRQGKNDLYLGIYPAFKDNGKEIKILFTGLPDYLVKETDKAQLNLNLHRLPVFYASWRALESEDIARANTFLALYNKEIEKETQDQIKKTTQYVKVVGDQ